ncbi:DNA polymerase III subunit delta [Schnuerera sp. xch1]|uniref:DNA polymerase III subunit delta n=1 Tax=Schnuerera sp. xch1 TaxID=2874283 RepID=UPI001CC138F3|nr:DNA polymerase III subunit delta [Schnuerera sp. xch1]MBZ2175751.1 DNA polymerase III subunit delta [Schnuerera sp. xch1]
MNYKEFINKVKDKDLDPVYLFYGEEEYMLDYTLKILKDVFIDESFEALNYIALEGIDINFDKIINACETLPFMSEKKIVVIKDFPSLKSKNEEGNNSLEIDIKTLSKYIEKLEDYICLVFIVKQKDVRKSNVLYKSIKKTNGIVEFKKLKGKDLDTWIQNKFSKYNKKISKSNINYLVQQSSYFDLNRTKTLYNLENEIIKICNYLLDKNEVTKESIDLLVSKPLEINVFNLLNNISQKRGENVIKLFNDMYISNEPVLFILYMIVRQLRNMLNFKLLKTKGYSEGDIHSKMNLSRYEFKKVSNQSNNFTVSQLKSAMLYCLETDKVIKSSSMDDRLALEVLLTKLCSKI